MWLNWLVFCDYGFSASALWCPLAIPTILFGFLLPWTWGISSRLLQQSAAAAPYFGGGYLLTAAPPDLERGVAPLRPPVPAQPLNIYCINSQNKILSVSLSLFYRQDNHSKTWSNVILITWPRKETAWTQTRASGFLWECFKYLHSLLSHPADPVHRGQFLLPWMIPSLPCYFFSSVHLTSPFVLRPYPQVAHLKET